jgi:DNA segregation ATPase FtsK/SpoIIIE-like protein
MDTPNRHNGGPLNDEDGRKLWDHIRALEVLDEQAAEVRLDIQTRKALAKSDGFDPNIIGTIMKRRKIGAGETKQADNLVQLYEEALVEQGALPLEEGRRRAPERKTTQEIADELHGQAAPANPRIEAEQAERDRDLYASALRIVVATGKASTSHLQRQLQIGYNTAARLVEQMEREGKVSAPDHVGLREVIDFDAVNKDPF